MSDAPPPLRMSDWKAGKGPPDPPKLPGGVPPPVVPPVQTAPGEVRPVSNVSGDEDSGESLPSPLAQEAAPPLPPTLFQGFDLLRLPRGVLRWWWIPVSLGIIGTILGLLAGLQVFSVSSSISVRLMARSPQSLAASSSAYVPATLQGATLLGALASPQVASEVADRFGEGYTARQLRAMVEIEEVRKTDFVDIIITTDLSPELTVELATVWAEEALRFTSHLQAEESGEMRKYLEEQIKRTDAELEEVNKRIVEMRAGTGGVDAERQIDNYLKSLQDLDLRFETNKIDLESLDIQLASLRKEIRKHSPSFEELKLEENKLAEMAEYYTEQNPIYMEALDRVEALRARVQDEIEAPTISLSEFTGTYVGNALYLQILELESRRENFLLQQEQLTEMRDQARGQLEKLPEAAMRASPLLEGAQTLRTARDALLGRLKEVTVFQDMAPGYYRMFRAPTAKDVDVSSRRSKLVVAALAGGILFFAVGLVGGAGLEYLDPKVRTPAEAQAALACLHLAQVEQPKDDEETGIVAAQDLWARVLGSLSQGRVRTFWAPVATPNADVFWSALFAAGRSLESRILVVHLGGEGPDAMATLPRVGGRQLANPPPDEPILLREIPVAFGLGEAGELIEQIQAARQMYQEVWIQTSGSMREPVAKVLRNFGETVILCQLGAADRNFWKTQRTLVSTQRPLRGVVTLSA